MADSSRKPVGFGRETARKLYRMSQQHSMGSMVSRTNPPMPMSFSFWQATLRENLGGPLDGGIGSGVLEETTGTAEADLWIIDEGAINDPETIAYKLQGEPYIRVIARDPSVWGRPGDYVCGIIHGGEFLALSGRPNELQILELAGDLPDMTRDDSTCYHQRAYVIQPSFNQGTETLEFERSYMVWVSSFGFTKFAFGAKESDQVDDDHGEIRGDFVLGRLTNFWEESPDPYVEPDIYQVVAGGRTHARFELKDDLHADKTDGSGASGEIMAYRVRDFPDTVPDAAAPLTWSLRPSRVNETAEHIVFAEQSFTGYCFGDDGEGETATRGEIVIAEWVPRQNDTLVVASDFPSGEDCGVVDGSGNLKVFGGGHWRIVGGGHSVLVGYSESNYNQGDTGDVTVEFIDTTAIDPIGRAIEVHEFMTPIKASDAENTYEVTIVWDAAKKRWYGYQFRGPGCGLRINTEAGDDFGRVELDPEVFGEGLEWQAEYCRATLDIDCDTLKEIFPPSEEIELDEYCVMTIKQVSCDKMATDIPCCDEICERLDSIEDRLDTIEDIIEYLIECCEENRTCCRYNTYCCEYLDARVDYCCGPGKPGPGDPGGGPPCGRCVWEWDAAENPPVLIESCGQAGCDCTEPLTFDVPGIYFTDCFSTTAGCCPDLNLPVTLLATVTNNAQCPKFDGQTGLLVHAGGEWVGDVDNDDASSTLTLTVYCENEEWFVDVAGCANAGTIPVSSVDCENFQLVFNLTGVDYTNCCEAAPAPDLTVTITIP